VSGRIPSCFRRAGQCLEHTQASQEVAVGFMLVQRIVAVGDIAALHALGIACVKRRAAATGKNVGRRIDVLSTGHGCTGLVPEGIVTVRGGELVLRQIGLHRFRHQHAGGGVIRERRCASNRRCRRTIHRRRIVRHDCSLQAAKLPARCRRAAARCCIHRIKAGLGSAGSHPAAGADRL
jgi:hypothetical protein